MIISYCSFNRIDLFFGNLLRRTRLIYSKPAETNNEINAIIAAVLLALADFNATFISSS